MTAQILSFPPRLDTTVPTPSLAPTGFVPQPIEWRPLSPSAVQAIYSAMESMRQTPGFDTTTHERLYSNTNYGDTLFDASKQPKYSQDCDVNNALIESNYSKLMIEARSKLSSQGYELHMQKTINSMYGGVMCTLLTLFGAYIVANFTLIVDAVEKSYSVLGIATSAAVLLATTAYLFLMWIYATMMLIGVDPTINAK